MEQEREEWRPVVGWEEQYEVSNLGRVCRVQTGYMLKPYQEPRGGGSYKVKLYAGSRHGARTITRLVAMAFLGEPPQKDMNVYHKDNDLTNNRVDNLYWDRKHPIRESIEKSITWRKTEEGRATYRTALKRRLLDPGKRVSFDRSRKVICVETGVIYPSQTEAAKAFGLSPNSVSSSCRNYDTRTRRIWQVSDKPVFHFRYYNPEDYKPKERIWKPVVGFEGKYEVSNLGEVRNAKTKRLRKPYQSRVGWPDLVSLVLPGGKTTTSSVSRLVAMAFIPRTYGALVVCHRDGDCHNNCVTNLFWSDKIGVATPVAQDRYIKNKAIRSVVCVETGKLYKTVKEAAKDCQLKEGAVYASCRSTGKATHSTVYHGKVKPVLHFRYADQ